MSARRGEQPKSINATRRDAALSATNPMPLNPVIEDVDELVLQISRILSDQKPHPAGELAYVLGVSSKTIRRKIHLMRDELNFPIEPTRKGFVVRDDAR